MILVDGPVCSGLVQSDQTPELLFVTAPQCALVLLVSTALELSCPLRADVIFVDSPVNVGFSYSDDPRDRVFDEATVADDLLDFMQEFLKGGARFRAGPGGWKQIMEMRPAQHFPYLDIVVCKVFPWGLHSTIPS